MRTFINTELTVFCHQIITFFLFLKLLNKNIMHKKQALEIPIGNILENLSFEPFKSNQNKIEFIRGP
jgi:hypothetical protein